MSSPYYQFGYEPVRHASSWKGGAGGVMPGQRAAESSGLGGSWDSFESGLRPGTLHYPPLQKHVHILGLGALSDNEKMAVKVIAVGAAVAAFLYYKKKRPRYQDRRNRGRGSRGN